VKTPPADRKALATLRAAIDPLTGSELIRRFYTRWFAIDGSIRDRTREMHGLLKIFEPDALLTDDIWGYLWGKLAYGAMLFATALTPDSMTANFADPARAPAWLAIGREVAAVANARGVSLRGFGAFRPEAFAPGAPEAEALDAIAWLAEYTAQSAKTHSGIWRDLAVRKRRTEIDAQIGVVGGRVHGDPDEEGRGAIDRLADVVDALVEPREQVHEPDRVDLIHPPRSRVVADVRRIPCDREDVADALGMGAE